MTVSVVYTCVARGYDRVAPVRPEWSCRFVMFHDGTVEVPAGWEGRKLMVDGVHGIHLNRYAKMLPHRLKLETSQSLYVDGNIVLNRDPGPKITSLLSKSAFAAYAHPSRDCAYDELREALRLGFIWPLGAWHHARLFRRTGLPRRAGLIEANVLFRRHNDPAIERLGEAWWRLWQEGLGRDQPLLAAALQSQGMTAHIVGKNMRADPDGALSVVQHARLRTRAERLPRRLAAELMLFRKWLP